MRCSSTFKACLAAGALLLLSVPGAFSEEAVIPSWATIEPSEEVKTCIAAHGAKARPFPNAYGPRRLDPALLVPDYVSSDPKRHECALRTEYMSQAYPIEASNRLNGYSPFVSYLQAKREMLAKGSSEIRCRAFGMMHEVALALDAAKGGEVPDNLYQWLAPSGRTECQPAK